MPVVKGAHRKTEVAPSMSMARSYSSLSQSSISTTPLIGSSLSTSIFPLLSTI